MSSSSNPLSELVLADPAHPNTTHPMVRMLACPQPFTLLKEQDGVTYKMSFRNETAHSAFVFVKGFAGDPTDVKFTAAIFGVQPGQMQTLQFSQADLHGSTTLWVGAWWASGPYGTNEAGIRSYFQDHPNTPEHHTVPVIIS
jgi:hypothetical protein